jgi:hypothetical protein
VVRWRAQNQDRYRVYQREYMRKYRAKGFIRKASGPPPWAAPTGPGDEHMVMVMIKCVAAGRQVFTGVETDPASVALIPPINAPLSVLPTGTPTVGRCWTPSS